MTRDEHLQFCMRCTNRKFDAQQGIVCSITNRQADFEDICPNFNADETVKAEPQPAVEAPNHQVVNHLSDDIKKKLRTQQDTVYAIIGGAASALLGATLWAAITVATNYQIGYMAIGVGALVGFAVRYYGVGVDQHFGGIGAVFALIGCMLGNLFSQVVFIAEAQSMNFFQVLFLLDASIIGDIFAESFSGIDLIFYGIAGYEGYRFAFRQIDEKVLRTVAEGKMPEIPMAKYRVPTAIILFLMLPTVYFLSRKGADGETTSYYESGAMQARGELVNGEEHGPWKGWHENGQVFYTGTYNNGKQEGIWIFYDDKGVKYREASFKNNIEHGTWTDYYPSGQVSSTGNYENGRQNGLWKFHYEDGKIFRQGTMYLDRAHGEWETYFEDGKLSLKSAYDMGQPAGKWTSWDGDGNVLEVTEYEHGRVRIISSNYKGQPEVVNGEGIYALRYEDGAVGEIGEIKDGKRAGTWKRYSPESQLIEVGEYKGDEYYVVDVWTATGEQIVTKGEGYYQSSTMERPGSILSGKIIGGLKEEQWRVVNESAVILQELTYVHGKLEGPCINFFESGTKYSEGNFKNDLQDGEWTWYTEAGDIESTATFVKGKKEGTQYIYGADGMITRSEQYEGGKLVSVNTDY